VILNSPGPSQRSSVALYWSPNACLYHTSDITVSITIRHGIIHQTSRYHTSRICHTPRSTVIHTRVCDIIQALSAIYPTPSGVPYTDRGVSYTKRCIVHPQRCIVHQAVYRTPTGVYRTPKACIACRWVWAVSYTYNMAVSYTKHTDIIVPANDDWLRPCGYKSRNVLAYDRGSKYSTIQDISNCA